jgi:hypothetical protein
MAIRISPSVTYLEQFLVALLCFGERRCFE